MWQLRAKSQKRRQMTFNFLPLSHFEFPKQIPPCQLLLFGATGLKVIFVSFLFFFKNYLCFWKSGSFYLRQNVTWAVHTTSEWLSRFSNTTCTRIQDSSSLASSPAPGSTAQGLNFLGFLPRFSPPSISLASNSGPSTHGKLLHCFNWTHSQLQSVASAHDPGCPFFGHQSKARISHAWPAPCLRNGAACHLSSQ